MKESDIHDLLDDSGTPQHPWFHPWECAVCTTIPAVGIIVGTARLFSNKAGDRKRGLLYIALNLAVVTLLSVLMIYA